MLVIRKSKIRSGDLKLFLGVALMGIAYEFIVVNHCRMFEVDLDSYAYLAVDYSIGFCSRLLPGAIYHLLVGVYDYTTASIYLMFFYIIYILLLSALIVKIVKRIPKDCSFASIVLLVLLLTGSFSISMYFKQVGILDFYLSFFLVIALLLVDNKYLKYSIPVISFLMVLVHYSADISHLTILFMVLLGFILFAKNKKTRIEYSIILVISALIAVTASLYFMKYDQANLKYTVDEFTQLMKSRKAEDATYYIYGLYRVVPESFIATAGDKVIKDLTSIPSGDLFGSIKMQILYNLRFVSIRGITITSSLCLVFAVFLYSIFIKYIRSVSEKKVKLFCIMVLLVFPVFLLSSLLFSTDYVRWFGHGIVFMIAMVFTISLQIDTRILKSSQDILSRFNPFVIPLVFLNAMIILNPYN